jgi:hypothetical protein
MHSLEGEKLLSSENNNWEKEVAKLSTSQITLPIVK